MQAQAKLGYLSITYTRNHTKQTLGLCGVSHIQHNYFTH